MCPDPAQPSMTYHTMLLVVVIINLLDWDICIGNNGWATNIFGILEIVSYNLPSWLLFSDIPSSNCAESQHQETCLFSEPRSLLKSSMMEIDQTKISCSWPKPPSLEDFTSHNRTQLGLTSKMGRLLCSRAGIFKKSWIETQQRLEFTCLYLWRSR